MKSLRLLLLTATLLPAQQTVAPTPGAVGPIRGDEVEGYNIVNSFELGYRFADVNGNRGKYRSDVNYRNGVRLLGSQLSINSKSGQGRFFDQIVLTTQGLGNDPYESSNLRIEKNGLYRFDSLWRMSEYFNPALAISGGRHTLDTSRRLQDHDLTLLPQGKIKFHLGYSRNTQDGPGLSTVQLFDARGDEFPLFVNVRRQFNEFRLGSDIEIAGFKLSLLRAWHHFREDTPLSLDGGSPGANAEDRTTLTSLRRAEPYTGDSPLWRVNLQKETSRWAASARYTNVSGRRNFALDETAAGVNRLGAASNRQVIVAGSGSRPVTTGDLLLTVFPTAKLTITNNTSFHHSRIDGDSLYREVNNSFGTDGLLYFRFLGIRTIGNFTDATYRAAPWATFYTGYHYSTRRIRSIEGSQSPPFESDSFRNEQENVLHSGVAGVRLKPARPVTVNLDGEVARADRPFTPVSERNLHALGARIQYKERNVLLSAAYRQNYNFNSVTLSAHSARSRSYFVDASWTPRNWFAVDASYSKLHLDTVTGLAFFSIGGLIEGSQSIYVSNIHAGTLGARFALRRRADLYIGYSVTRDAGDGNGVTFARPGLALSTAFLLPVQTFPLRFESPLARVSIRINQHLRWNAGWQFYRYREDYPLTIQTQNYRANTGYTSVLWSF